MMTDEERAAETPEQFRNRMRSIGYLSKGQTRNRVSEYRTDADHIKKTTDELGNTVTEHKDDRVDVNVRPQTVYMKGMQVN